jgi:hypothetical protein
MRSSKMVEPDTRQITIGSPVRADKLMPCYAMHVDRIVCVALRLQGRLGCLRGSLSDLVCACWAILSRSMGPAPLGGLNKNVGEVSE